MGVNRNRETTNECRVFLVSVAEIEPDRMDFDTMPQGVSLVFTLDLDADLARLPTGTCAAVKAGQLPEMTRGRVEKSVGV